MSTSRRTDTAPATAPDPIPAAARGLSLACAALGAAGLSSWILDLPPVRQLSPSLPGMQPNTALALLAAGLSLALPDNARPWARLLAVVTVTIGALTTVEYVAGVDLGIDAAVLRGTTRMAPQAAVGLALLGLGLLARRSGRYEHLAQPLVAIPVVLCYHALVGLFFAAKVPGFPNATAMAVLTGLAVLTLSLGIAVSQPQRGFTARWRSAGPGGHTTRTLLPAIVLLPPVLAVLRGLGEHRGVYDEGFGIALQATVSFVLLAGGVLLHSRSLDAAADEHALAERLRRIVQDLPEGVCLLDATGRILHANPRLFDLLGRPGAEVRALSDCVDPDVHPVFDDFLRQARQGPARATVAVRAGDGTLRSLRFSATPLGDPLAPLPEGTLLLVIDETSRRIAEAHLRDRARQLEHALRDVSEFATLASHELREPLRKIQLLADTIADDTARPEATPRETAVRIHRAAALLQERVAALLKYARLGASLRRVAGVDLGKIVRGAEAAHAEQLREAGATVEIGVLPTIEGDPALLHDLFCCLFENAIKFRRPEVPLVLRIDSAPRSRERVAITVADNGFGLEAADISHLFGVFRTVHGPEAYPGAGMGLATCRRIAELHGGEISAEGSPGEGSVFTICLPVRAQQGVPPECTPHDAP